MQWQIMDMHERPAEVSCMHDEKYSHGCVLALKLRRFIHACTGPRPETERHQSSGVGVQRGPPPGSPVYGRSPPTAIPNDLPAVQRGLRYIYSSIETDPPTLLDVLVHALDRVLEVEFIRRGDGSGRRPAPGWKGWEGSERDGCKVVSIRRVHVQCDKIESTTTSMAAAISPLPTELAASAAVEEVVNVCC